MSSDRDIPTISIKNGEALLIRQNGAYSVDFEINDDSGIEYIQVNSENKIYSSKFSYTFTKNGSNVISAMDNAGNLAEFYIPVTNINESPVVSLSNSSNGEWTSSNVYIDVSTSHDVIYRHPDSVYSSRTGLGGKYFPNYFNYSQSKFRVSGKMKLNSQLGAGIGDKSYLIPSLGYNRKWLTDDGYFSDVLYIGPKDSEYIKVKDLSSTEFTDFEYEITIPKNYSHNLHALMDTKNVGALGDSHLEIELKDLTYELINDDEDSGFKIKSIELPNGKIVNQNKYTDVIEEEGIYSNLEYKILDSRDKETIKRTSVKIDKTAPELDLTYDKDELVNNKSATINITASDNLSGVKRIRLPNGNYVNSNKAVYNINGNGGYVFECEDVAGNITTKVISINGGNSNLNTNIDKGSNWTNNGVQINIDLRK